MTADLPVNSATSRATSATAGRRGQMLGMGPRDGWAGWDRIEALIPESELDGLEAELRSLSHGLASYEAEFDHLAEVNGRAGRQSGPAAREARACLAEVGRALAIGRQSPSPWRAAKSGGNGSPAWMPWLTNTASIPNRAAPSMSVSRPSPIASTSLERRIAGEAQRVGVDRRVRLAVPGDAPAERFVAVGERAGAGLAHAAVDHLAVGVEAVEQHVARRPALRGRRR